MKNVQIIAIKYYKLKHENYILFNLIRLYNNWTEMCRTSKRTSLKNKNYICYIYEKACLKVAYCYC